MGSCDGYARMLQMNCPSICGNCKCTRRQKIYGERAFLNSLKIIIHVRRKRVMKHRCAVLECGGLKKKERKTALYHMRMLSS